MVGYSRHNFMVPLSANLRCKSPVGQWVPRFPSWEAFNAYLEEQCRRRKADVLRGQSETIEDRLTRDLAAMTELPAAPFDACDQATGRVSSQALVRYKTNDYSVSVAYGHRDVWIRGIMPEACLRHDVEAVVIGCGGEGEPHGRQWFEIRGERPPSALLRPRGHGLRSSPLPSAHRAQE